MNHDIALGLSEAQLNELSTKAFPHLQSELSGKKTTPSGKQLEYEVQAAPVFVLGETEQASARREALVRRKLAAYPDLPAEAVDEAVAHVASTQDVFLLRLPKVHVVYEAAEPPLPLDVQIDITSQLVVLPDTSAQLVAHDVEATPISGQANPWKELILHEMKPFLLAEIQGLYGAIKSPKLPYGAGSIGEAKSVVSDGNLIVVANLEGAGTPGMEGPWPKSKLFAQLSARAIQAMTVAGIATKDSQWNDQGHGTVGTASYGWHYALHAADPVTSLDDSTARIKLVVSIAGSVGASASAKLPPPPPLPPPPHPPHIPSLPPPPPNPFHHHHHHHHHFFGFLVMPMAGSLDPSQSFTLEASAEPHLEVELEVELSDTRLHIVGAKPTPFSVKVTIEDNVLEIFSPVVGPITKGVSDVLEKAIARFLENISFFSQDIEPYTLDLGATHLTFAPSGLTVANHGDGGLTVEGGLEVTE